MLSWYSRQRGSAFQQWMEGKRKIKEIKLNETKELEEKELQEGLIDYVVSEEELRYVLFVTCPNFRIFMKFGYFA